MQDKNEGIFDNITVGAKQQLSHHCPSVPGSIVPCKMFRPRSIFSRDFNSESSSGIVFESLTAAIHHATLDMQKKTQVVMTRPLQKSEGNYLENWFLYSGGADSFEKPTR